MWFLFTGSRQYIWGHWRSFAWSVYGWYPLPVCQLQSKPVLIWQHMSDCNMSMNYSWGNNLPSFTWILKLRNKIASLRSSMIKISSRELWQVLCQDWQFLSGWVLEPSYTLLLLHWPGRCHWPLRAATLQLWTIWPGPPQLCRHRRPSSPQSQYTALTASKCAYDWWLFVIFRFFWLLWPHASIAAALMGRCPLN